MFEFNSYPYPSRRFVKYAVNGMCATSNHLAAQAGVDMLKKGGNAFDAAIAAATCLTVLEPQSNGIGADAFAIIWHKGKMYGLNSSGFMGRGFRSDDLRKKGIDKMPLYGFGSVTVPGAPAAWAAVNKRFGKLPLSEVVETAARYAEDGQATTQGIHDMMTLFSGRLKGELDEAPECSEWFNCFMPDGRVPLPGEIYRNPDQAKTLRDIGKTNAESFYRGDIAGKIDAYSRKYGGFVSAEDLASFSPEWVDPVSVNYRGYDVWELPPNGQGIVALMGLNILKNFEPSSNDVPSFHREIEALKLAFADGQQYIADPKNMTVSVKDLLSTSYGIERSKLIGDKAVMPQCGKPQSSGTVYMCAADGEGNMISFIQSNYRGFGSGVVIPGTGIGMQNRGLGFNLEEGHPNCAEGGKRPYHTIIPGFLTKDGKAIGPFGIMGGNMQPQAHLQVMVNYIDKGLNPQSSLDAPRWQWVEGMKIALEPAFAEYIMTGLKARGHDISVDLNAGGFGRGQIIFNTGMGTLMGATEPRCEGACEAW
ncbi:MAG: gamma-glutamyltransferase family protein [Clostridiaceae bacterium]|nr:gamma-glutamyltransferase family protein [Clostridiaceae bacterium]